MREKDLINNNDNYKKKRIVNIYLTSIDKRKTLSKKGNKQMDFIFNKLGL